MAGMTRLNGLLFAAAVVTLFGGPAIAADSVMVQCGQQYQAAKAAGTLNGLSWAQYRGECAARMKAQPAATPVATPAVPTAPAPATPVPTAAAPAVPTPAGTPAPATSAAAPTGGRAAMLVRQKQCGAEWRAQKATLVAQTPGLTWPRYWSQCNTRLKTTGQ